MVGETPEKSLVRLYVSETYYRKHEQELKKYGSQPEVLTDSVFAHVSDTKSPQGILAVVRQMSYTMEEIAGQKNPHILVLDNLQDPGNL